MIDAKDLMPVKAIDIVFNGTFYRKESDGSFSMCKLYPEDIDEVRYPLHSARILKLTEQYEKEGRLFRRRSKPWASFA